MIVFNCLPDRHEALSEVINGPLLLHRLDMNQMVAAYRLNMYEGGQSIGRICIGEGSLSAEHDLGRTVYLLNMHEECQSIC